MIKKALLADTALQNWRNDHMPFLAGAENRETFFRRIAGFLPTLDPRYRAIEKAYDAAKDAFRGDKRDGGERYFEHLRAVALILLVYCEIRDPDLIIAALLHDIVEDKSEWTIERVRIEFGERVAFLVEYLTKPDGFGTKEECERIYHERFQAAPREFFFIKLADRLHNLLTLGARPRDKQIDKIAETERYYMRYARQHFILLAELREVVAILHRGQTPQA